MDRRELLKTVAVASSVAILSRTGMLTDSDAFAQERVEKENAPSTGDFPALPYSADALAPVIDAETMMLHHGAHHRAYFDKLNAALTQWSAQSDAQNYSPAQAPLVELLANLDKIPENFRQTIRNQGGGHFNHTLFWETMTPGKGGTAFGEVGKEIAATFGGFDQFKEKFETAGISHFGSGWVWLSLGRDGRLDLGAYPNQDSPVMAGKTPIIGNDLWEHAYYLSYRNRRAEYLKAWWNVVNWGVVEKRFVEARAARG